MSLKKSLQISFIYLLVNPLLKQRIIRTCDDKIYDKGTNVGLSFYAFFENKNTEPELLMEAAKWWIMEHKLDHFEKAVRIKKMVEEME